MSNPTESFDIILPVEPPAQFAAPDRPFLPEVYEFLWLRQAQTIFDVRGRGLTAAVLDTGINAEHIDFAGKIKAGRNFTTDYGGDPNNFADGNGHGTNVAGIIVANGNHIGIAPEASVTPLKVLRNKNGGDFDSIRRALDWVIAHAKEYRISVVCMSLGNGANYTEDSFPANHVFAQIRRRMRSLRRRRIAVVAAAGNHFFKHDSEPGMSFPAIARECVSVGALYDDDVGSMAYLDGARAFTTEAGQITPFSQRLPYSQNSSIYTTVFAPGAPVRSSGLNGTHGESEQQGTSQAAPTVAGLILLMQEYYLTRTGRLPSVYNLERWLRNGSVRIKDGDNEDDNVVNTNRFYGRTDAVSALNEVRRYLLEH